jgi:hypothetical protein
MAKSTLGGARKGAGRKAGGTNKLTAQALLDEVKRVVGKPYETQIAENYFNCIKANDKPMIATYDKLFLSKVIADKSAVDITSAGEKLAAQFAFMPVELPEWASKKTDEE